MKITATVTGDDMTITVEDRGEEVKRTWVRCDNASLMSDGKRHISDLYPNDEDGGMLDAVEDVERVLTNLMDVMYEDSMWMEADDILD